MDVDNLPLSELRAAVTFLSAVLHYSRPDTTKSRNPQDKAKANIRQAVSTLLTTGGESDQKGSKVFAVIGSLKRDSITAILTSRNLSPWRRTPNEPRIPTSETFESDATKGSEVLQNVLQGERKDADNFKGHIQDVVNMIHYFMKDKTDFSHMAASELADGANAISLFLFIVYRCRYKLLSRIQNGRSIWKLDDDMHPTTYIHAQLKKATISSISIPEDTYVSLPGKLRSALEAVNISRDLSHPAKNPDHDSYPVTAENAATWAQVFEDCLNTMETRLEALVNGEKKKKEGGAEARDTIALYGSMKRLKSLLDSNVLHFLLTPNIKEKLDKARKPSFSQVEKLVRRTVQGTGEDDARSESDTDKDIPGSTADVDTDKDDEEAAEALPDDDEPVGDHLTRYLKTLTMALDITSIILYLPKISPAPPLTAIYVDDGPLERFNVWPYLGMVREEIQKILAEDVNVSADDLNKTLNDAASQVNKSSVHAEATLMARVLSAFTKGSPPEEQASLAKDKTIAIGVSKKCCYCCHLLARLVTERLGGVQLILPGTHSIVVPWHPPDGLPIDILKRMTEKLFQAVRERLTDATVVPSLTQTTPLHSSADLPEEDELLEILLAARNM
ncbi:uncharacterized protein BXZ73DRAFT_101811 [Epithele typhae]|uniref:uncharacterized protein n=1 Tax=Epithele typhae TaxID=378194 RepID=UPI002007E4FA|nr:uncharacterized protein BXZ73DRAFT_101811 [Epithele typhae]KAH9930437.1 hypothetical protein BXZ73DRAFT_101811 [Epithele typhae]